MSTRKSIKSFWKSSAHKTKEMIRKTRWTSKLRSNSCSNKLSLETQKYQNSKKELKTLKHCWCNRKLLVSKLKKKWLDLKTGTNLDLRRPKSIKRNCMKQLKILKRMLISCQKCLGKRLNTGKKIKRKRMRLFKKCRIIKNNI